MNNKLLNKSINTLTDALCEMDRGETDWDTIYDMVEKAVNDLEKYKKSEHDLINKLDGWLDIVNYWEDEIRDVAERYDSEYRMYERYNRMIDDIYNTIQKLKKGELNENI